MKYWICMWIAGCLSIAGRAQTELPLEFKAAPVSGADCNCGSGGFPLSASLQWKMASCKFDCRNGWGMDCGLSWVLLCSNGQQVVCPVSGNCRTTLIDPLRQVQATQNFFSNGTLRLSFQSELPPPERGQSGFDVPAPILVPLPAGLTIGGRAYSAFRIAAGAYPVDLSVGKWGSVVLRIDLVE
jgi:hypothetical protein